LLFFSSCIKKTLYDIDIIGPSEPPEVTDTAKKKVIIKINWENMEADDMAENVILEIDGRSFIVEKRTQPDTLYLLPGDYDIYIYSVSYDFTINNLNASINNDSNGKIKNDPVAFYSASEKLTVQGNDNAEVIMVPVRNTCKLILRLHIDGYSLDFSSGTLSNMAGAFDIKTMNEKEPSYVDLFFMDYTSEINTFGTVGINQVLLFEANVDDSTKIRCEKDIGNLLTNFNNDKTETQIIDVYINDDELEHVIN
jgi:hypothetical protein